MRSEQFKIRRLCYCLCFLITALKAQAQLDVFSIGHTNVGGTLPWGGAQSIQIVAPYAYVAHGGPQGMQIYAITNLTNPIKIGQASMGFGSAYGTHDIAISGNHAYLAQDTDGLVVFNISNKKNPVFVERTNDGGTAYGIAIMGNYAYLANGTDGLRAYSIANPSNMVNVGHATHYHSTTNILAFAQNVTLSGNFAYLANQRDGVRVYDISNPTNLLNIARITHYNSSTNSQYSARDIAISGNHAFVAGFKDGLRIYDISNPANPIYIARTNNSNASSAGATGIAIAESKAFLANFDDGFRVYDISTLTTPIQIARSQTNFGGTALGLALHDDNLLLANGNDGLRVFSMACPKLQATHFGSEVVVSWPTNSLILRVQKSTDLFQQNWEAVTNSSSKISNRTQIIFPANQEKQFYRLSYP